MKIPVIHQTDLFHYHCDPDDHWDLACQFALAYMGDIDLKGVLVDYPPKDRVNPILNEPYGDPSIQSVSQMNYITGLTVPISVGTPEKLVEENPLKIDISQPGYGGVKMVLKTLEESLEPVAIHIVGSCRDIAIAGLLNPELFMEKCKGIYLNAGNSCKDDTSSEYNVTLDPFSFSTIFNIPCPIYWMPCFDTLQGVSDENYKKYKTHYSFKQADILPYLSENMQKYFLYMFSREQGNKWLAYLMEIYVGDYGDINTIADATTPASEMTNEGFRVSTRTNKSRADLFNNDDTGVQRINTEVFFFSGHGNSGLIQFYDDSTLTTGSVPDLYRMKLAVLAGCETGLGSNSIAQRFSTSGAFASVGWTTTTTVGSSRTFTNSFFKEMDDGRTVLQACQTASGKLLWPWDGAKNYRIFGDSGYFFLSQVTWNSSSVYVSNATLGELESDMTKFNYVTENIGNFTRYYKTIDGMLTNDFYDVYDNGAVIKSENTISVNEAANIKQKISTAALKQSSSISQYDKNDMKTLSSRTFNVIYKDHNGTYPVEITEVTYQNDAGCKVVECYCMNMLSGESINYDDISVAK